MVDHFESSLSLSLSQKTKWLISNWLCKDLVIKTITALDKISLSHIASFFFYWIPNKGSIIIRKKWLRLRLRQFMKSSPCSEFNFNQFLFFRQSPRTNGCRNNQDFEFRVPPLCAVYKESLYIPHTMVGRETQNPRYLNNCLA